MTGRAGGTRRLLGLRRGGPEPPATRAGQPLHPLTLPNLIGFVRIGLLGVFAVVAFSSDDGREPLSTACYAAAAGSDYLDGIVARVTGQYSRLGALMDPLIDRLVVIVGVAVVWHFELLPRWALAVLLAREAVMLVIVARRPAPRPRPAHQLARAQLGVVHDGCGGRGAARVGRRQGAVPVHRHRRFDCGQRAVRARRAA